MASLVIDVHPDEPGIFAGEAVNTYRFVCDQCSKPMSSPNDHVLFMGDVDGQPTEVKFRHMACDSVPTAESWLTVGRFLSSLRAYGTFEPAED